MASNMEHNFNYSGPQHLTVNWTDENYGRSVAACLVQGVYVLEGDRREKRRGPQALAHPWWESFNFVLVKLLVDNVDSSIFGAIYEYRHPAASYCNHTTNGSPRYVIAFRGTLLKPETYEQDVKLALKCFVDKLPHEPRFMIAMQAVQERVDAGDCNIWLTGHSLGSAIAMLAGKNVVHTRNIFLKTFLFNPPFFSVAVTERITNKKVKDGIRIIRSCSKAVLTSVVKNQSKNQFFALSSWVPCLFVNPADLICLEYVGYFQHRKKMEKNRAKAIERSAAHNTFCGLIKSAVGKESELPVHLIPSANLTLNLTPSQDRCFIQAHVISQWWRPDLHLDLELHKYE